MPRRQYHALESNNFKLCVFCLLVLSLAQIAPAQDKTKAAVRLETGKQIEREISAAGNHKYEFTLAAGQFASVIVEQRGVDVTLTLGVPDGETIAEIDSDQTGNGSEKAESVAATNGVFSVEVKPSLSKTGSGKYLIRLAEIRTATGDDKLLDEARRQNYESGQRLFEGNFDQAIALASRAIEIRENFLGANHADTQASLLAASRAYLGRGNLPPAEIHARRAAESAAKIFGADSLNYAEAASLLGRVKTAQTAFADAERLQLEALAARVKTAGADSLPAALSYFHLGSLYRAMNDYAKAETNFTKALEISEKLLGEDHHTTADILSNFGLFFYGAGDYEKAYRLTLRSLLIREKLLPPNHYRIGTALNNLGLIAWKKLDYEQARIAYVRALKIFEVTNGAESDGVAGILYNLGIIYQDGDADYAKAEESYKRALAITEKNHGEFYFTTGNIANGLSILYRRAGDLERAERFGSRSLTIYEKVFGEYNHYTTLALTNLIRIYAAKGETARAVEHLKRLNQIYEKVVPLNLRTGSERQKIAYYRQINRFDDFLTLHAGLASRSPEMRDLAVTEIFRHKAIVLDAVSENLSGLRERFGEADRRLLDDLANVNSGLSKVITSNRLKLSADEQRKQIKVLEEERDRIEAEISRRSAGFFQPSSPATLEAIRASIPLDAALVEFAVYQPFRWNAPPDESNRAAPRYVAYIVRREGEVQWKDLGETKIIDRAIDEWRAALRDPRRTDATKLARALDEKLMQPVRAFLGDAAHILVSPDGSLSLIPFEALVNERGDYLIEKYLFTYLTSGRDLLRMQTAPASGAGEFLIVAAPNFNAAAENTNDKQNSRAERQSVTATRSPTETYFAPLGGTLREAGSIKEQFPDAKFLIGSEATETALKRIRAPGILHIATHGFFLQDSAEDGAKNEIENPLLRSGLALAGANDHRSAASDDGILTALEASGLNLWGTKLVVLSACDTGLGAVKNGEGVYGLRRAFALAGAQSVVMSLWSVSDQVTRELMIDYYKNLKQGVGRGASLRQVQLAMLKRKGRTHPFYWASFIQSGEWANLDGKR